MIPVAKYWQYLTDEQLLHAHLDLKDPEESGLTLVHSVPDDAKVLSIIAVYNCRPKLRRCPLCPSALHHKGYIVQLSDGTYAAIGHMCGSGIFEGEWHEHFNEFNQVVERQRWLRRVWHVPRLIDDAMRELNLWFEPLREFTAIRTQFETSAPGLFAHLQNSAYKEAGRLYVLRRELDLIRTEMRAKTGSNKEEPVYTDRLVPFARLNGANFLTRRTPFQMMAEARNRLREIKISFERKRQYASDLATISRSMSDCIGLLERALLVYEAYRRFSDTRQLAMLAKFAEETPSLGEVFYESNGELFRRQDDGNDIVVLAKKNLARLNDTPLLMLRSPPPDYEEEAPGIA